MSKMQKQIIESVLEQINKILIRKRNPFIEQYKDKEGKVNWMQRKYILTDNIIRSHIEGERTIGIYYSGNAAIFLFFDIDAEEDIWGQKYRAKRIIAELINYGIKEKDIHVMFSGSKGYHIQLFFDDSIPIKRLAAFGKKVVSNLGEFAAGIEIRPENINGRGIKLPLAYHKKTGKFAHYVDKENLEEIADSFGYFLQISPFNHEIMKKACDEALNKEKGQKQVPCFKEINLMKLEGKSTKPLLEMKLSVKNQYSLEEKAQELLKTGLKQRGTRHEAQFILALYYKGKGTSREKASQELSNWIIQQWNNKKTNERDLQFLKMEVERHVKYVYRNQKYKGLFSRRARKLVVSHRDIDFVAKQGKKSNRKVLLALLMTGKMYHTDGVFSADMYSLGKISGLSRQTVSTVLKELISQEVIEQVSDYKYSERLARTYYMKYITIKETNVKAAAELDKLTLSESFQILIQLVEESIF